MLPSMFTMLLSGFYAIVDGLFVGNAVGILLLGLCNLAYPIQVIVKCLTARSDWGIGALL